MNDKKNYQSPEAVVFVCRVEKGFQSSTVDLNVGEQNGIESYTMNGQWGNGEDFFD